MVVKRSSGIRRLGLSPGAIVASCVNWASYITSPYVFLFVKIIIIVLTSSSYCDG